MPSQILKAVLQAFPEGNRIIHAYDNVRPDFLWALYMRHIPLLKTDVEKIMTEMLSSR